MIRRSTEDLVVHTFKDTRLAATRRYPIPWPCNRNTSGQALLAFQMAAGGKSFANIVQATGVVANKSSLSTYLHNHAFLG